jgi:hypothetical protein
MKALSDLHAVYGGLSHFLTPARSFRDEDVGVQVFTFGRELGSCGLVGVLATG